LVVVVGLVVRFLLQKLTFLLCYVFGQSSLLLSFSLSLFLFLSDEQVDRNTISKTNVFHSVPNSLLYGVVQSTWVRGQCVYAVSSKSSHHRTNDFLKNDVKLNVGHALCHH